MVGQHLALTCFHNPGENQYQQNHRQAGIQKPQQADWQITGLPGPHHIPDLQILFRQKYGGQQCRADPDQQHLQGLGHRRSFQGIDIKHEFCQYKQRRRRQGRPGELMAQIGF